MDIVFWSERFINASKTSGRGIRNRTGSTHGARDGLVVHCGSALMRPNSEVSCTQSISGTSCADGTACFKLCAEGIGNLAFAWIPRQTCFGNRASTPGFQCYAHSLKQAVPPANDRAATAARPTFNGLFGSVLVFRDQWPATTECKQCQPARSAALPHRTSVVKVRVLFAEAEVLPYRKTYAGNRGDFECAYQDACKATAVIQDKCDKTPCCCADDGSMNDVFSPPPSMVFAKVNLNRQNIEVFTAIATAACIQAVVHVAFRTTDDATTWRVRKDYGASLRLATLWTSMRAIRNLNTTLSA